MRRRLTLPLLHVLALGLALGVTGVTSQEEQQPPEQSEVTVVVPGTTVTRIRMAFPAATVAAAGGLAPVAQESEETLRDDLDISGIFALQGPEQLSVAQLTGDPTRDYEIYRSLGNQVLLQVDYKSEGDILVLEGRLFDLKSGEPILGKRYRGEREAGRRIAHTFADEIIQYFSGRRGISLTSIAFYSDRSGAEPNQIKEIYIMDYDGRNQRPVTAHKTISLSPAWSPSGDAIAYTSFFSGRPGLYLVQLPSGNKKGIVTDGSLNVNPTFSPDGSRIAFTRSVGDGNPEIFVCDRDGGNLRQLTNSRGIDTSPAWSPNGRDIAFTSSRGGTPQIYAMDAEGANLRRITFEGSYNDGADWHPDGTKIIYSSRTGNRFDVVMADVVTHETRRLTAGPASNESPSFSPDGKRIVFARTLGNGAGRTQIFVMDADGGNLRQLTSQGNNWAPAWSGYPPN
ncbi:MAG: Tol-Pal system beta propeller repeat protein TolB [Thermoanaerobaculia bacterium]